MHQSDERDKMAILWKRQGIRWMTMGKKWRREMLRRNGRGG
jgi:hypothetical protein